MYEVKGAADNNMIALLGSTNAQYPLDTAILARVNAIFSSNKSSVQSTDIVTNLLNKGQAAFINRQYSKAAQFYIQAAQLIQLTLRIMKMQVLVIIQEAII